MPCSRSGKRSNEPAWIFHSRNRGASDRLPRRNNREVREKLAMRTLGILLGGAIALTACSTTTPPPPAPVDINNLLMAPGFLAHAGSANQYEIEASQLALQAS